MNTKESKFNQPNICYCQYCGKECKNLNSLKQHEARCKNNPDRMKNIGNQKGRVAWNKGKTKETDERVRKCGETYHKNYKEGKIIPWCLGKTKETDERLRALTEKVSNTVKTKLENGEWHTSFSKSRTYMYKGVQLYGEWEVNFAKYLDSKNIIWERPTKYFDYEYEGENHKYYPDFYLPAYDLYIEIKGYPTSRDFAKWDSFPTDCKLDIFFGDDLKNMNLVSEIKDVYKDIPERYRRKHANIF